MKLKYATICRENITYLDEGFIDMTTLKTVELGSVDMLTVPKQTLAEISSCFKVSEYYWQFGRLETPASANWEVTRTSFTPDGVVILQPGGIISQFCGEEEGGEGGL